MSADQLVRDLSSVFFHLGGVRLEVTIEGDILNATADPNPTDFEVAIGNLYAQSYRRRENTLLDDFWRSDDAWPTEASDSD